MIVLITGATAGIGEASAMLFAKNGFDVIITGRRKERLEEKAKEIKLKFNSKVLTLNFDIRDVKQVEQAINSLPADWKNIDILVNNAGLAAGFGPIQDGSIADWEQMIDTNVKGLLYMTKMVCPVMIERKQGHIINIASIAGKEVYPNGNVYCATKFAVDALSKAMRLDMLQYGIKVTSISPGMAETEFSLVRYKGDAEKAGKVYSGLKPLVSEDIAEAIYWAATRPDHVNINEIVLTPKAQGNAVNTVRKA